MFSGIDRVDSTLINCINMAESTMQHKKQISMRSFCGKPQNHSPKTTHKWTPEPTDISDPLFDQDFDQFMESLDNLEPYDDLEDWSDDVDLFMDAMSHSPHMADILWEEVKLKKQKGTSKTPSEWIWESRFSLTQNTHTLKSVV
jgi:hypothetical protein